MVDDKEFQQFLNKLIALDNQISAQPTIKALVQWKNHSRMYVNVYQSNRIALVKFMDAPETSEEVGELMDAFNMEKAEAYTDELTRLLYNYLAAETGLIDHSRRFVRTFGDEEFMSNYSEKVSRIAATTEHNLMKNLRNYALHYDVIPMWWRIYHETEKNLLAYKFYIRPELIVAWDGWSAISRRYLKWLIEREKPIDLMALLIKNDKNVVALNGWLYRQFRRLNTKDLAATRTLINQRDALMQSGLRKGYPFIAPGEHIEA